MKKKMVFVIPITNINDEVSVVLGWTVDAIIN